MSEMILQITVLIMLFYSIFVQISFSQNISNQDFTHIQKFRLKRLNYPIRFTYVNKINTWWPPKQTLLEMALPQSDNKSHYNYVALAFWTCQKGPTDISKIWDDPISYFGQQFGETKFQSLRNLKRKYNEKGISVILSAFGATQKPTTLGLDPILCATKLGNYVKQNFYDGVDIDYEDNQSINKGIGQNWVITFMQELRKILPYHIISHAPQAPYFMSGYTNGGYQKIHKEVGHLIDFYNVQFYNQKKSSYDTYEKLFINSGLESPKTSVSELIQSGIPSNMIVIGKPVSKQDILNSGYVHPSKMISFIIKGYRELNWNTGFMLWQFSSDKNFSLIDKLTKVLNSVNRN